MSNDAQFSLIEPFDVDDDSLNGLSPNYIFSLGVEWEMFRQKLATGKSFSVLCLPQNRDRFVKMAERHRRFVEDRQTACVDWLEVWVGDPISFAPPGPRPK
jgi:hypothetical protein